MFLKIQPIGYDGPNRPRKIAKTSVQATHAIESNPPLNDFCPASNDFIRLIRLPLLDSYPTNILSHTHSNFSEAAILFPELKKEFLLISKLKNEINSCSIPGIKWISICLKRKLDGSEAFIHLKFGYEKANFLETQKFVDSIIGSDL